MMKTAIEQLLDGGNLSKVVRIDDTVRRPIGPWTPAVHALLDHLEARDFQQAPRVLGIDEQGREILSYVEGTTVGSQQPFPEWVWREETIVQTGAMLRAYHDAVRDFVEPSGAQWRMHWAPQKRDEIICHFDVAPYNLVVRPDGGLALIDWDVSAPGTEMLELGKTVNAFLPIYDHHTRVRVDYVEGTFDGEMLELSIDLIRLMLEAYGLKSRTGFVQYMLDGAAHTSERIRRGAREGDKALRRLIGSGITDHVMQTRSLIAEKRDVLERALR